jgi:hypothetical protein
MKARDGTMNIKTVDMKTVEEFVRVVNAAVDTFWEDHPELSGDDIEALHALGGCWTKCDSCGESFLILRDDPHTLEGVSCDWHTKPSPVDLHHRQHAFERFVRGLLE